MLVGVIGLMIHNLGFSGEEPGRVEDFETDMEEVHESKSLSAIYINLCLGWLLWIDGQRGVYPWRKSPQRPHCQDIVAVYTKLTRYFHYHRVPKNS